MKRKPILLLTPVLLMVTLLVPSCNGGGSKPVTVKYKVNVLGGEGSAEVESGKEVTIKAYEDSDDPFINWTINGEEVSKDKEYKFTVDKDITITANYEFGKYCHTLYKDTNKDFKILNLTDIQLHDGETTDVTFRVLDELIKAEEPDMITFLGDMINDDETNDSKVNVPKVITKIDSYNIPWAPIFGNHDFEDYGKGSAKKTTSGELATWYKACKNCLFLDGPTMNEKLNIGNYVVNIVDSSTLKPVESLIFADSRLAGIQDDFLPVYKKALTHASLYNDKNTVPSVLFTHIAIPQYADAFTNSKKVEYRDMTGICNSSPDKLTAGTKDLFPLMKEKGSTKLMVVGHDHENSYYTTYDGIKLAYSTKSSDGDNFKNKDIVFPLGGSVVKLSTGKDEEFYYSKANNIFEINSDNPDIKTRVLDSDLVGFWKYSGAKLIFDVELPDTGELKFNLMGTNVLINGKTYLGGWNRLTENFTIDASTKKVDKGDAKLEQIKDNNYRLTLELKNTPLNTEGGQEARGDETIRLVYFPSVTGKFTVSNLHYEYEEITETDQVDLANATISDIVDQKIIKRTAEGASGFIPAKPLPTVTLNSKELIFGEDYYIEYENNDVAGTATAKIVPSGIGAHKYKGSKSSTFKVVEDTIRGTKFEAGKDLSETPWFKKSYDITKDTLIIDVYFESGADTHIQFQLIEKETKWAKTFGYFKVNGDGTLGNDKKGYDGLSIKTLQDGYHRITCDLKNITKYDTKPDKTVDQLYIFGKNSTASGYIDIEPTVE